MRKRLALTKDGRLTYCTASEENIGKGRCIHICHQTVGENESDFMLRANKEIYKIRELSNSINFTTLEREALNDLRYIFDGYGTANETDLFINRVDPNGKSYITIKEEYRDSMPHWEEFVYIVNTRKVPKGGLKMKDSMDMIQAAKWCKERNIPENSFYPNGSFCGCESMDDLRREFLYDKKYGLGLKDYDQKQISLGTFQKKYRSMCNYNPDFNEILYSGENVPNEKIEDYVRGYMTYIDGLNQDELNITINKSNNSDVKQVNVIYQGRDITPVFMQISDPNLQKIKMNENAETDNLILFGME